MHNGQFGGQIGPFRDPATGQTVAASANGSFAFACSGDPNAILPQLQSAILMAITNLVQHKLNSNQLAIPTLQQSAPYLVAEIIHHTGAERMGAQLSNLALNISVQQLAGPQIYQGPLPPTPMQSTMNAAQQVAQQHLDPRNYEVEAEVEVGGFKFNASTDKGLDTKGFVDQVKDKIQSALVWYAIGCGVVLFAGLLLVGIGVYGYFEYVKGSSGVTATGPGEAQSWDGKTPFTCGGSDNITLKGVTATFSTGSAVTAGANCHLVLENCTLDAATGISALANAVVEVKGGSVTGSDKAASALGNAKITFSGTKVKGKTQALGGAKITGP